MSDKKYSWRVIIRLIIFFLLLIGLYFLYWILIDLGSTPLLTFFILLFIFLFVLGVLLKRKGQSFFSRFKRDKSESPAYQEKKTQKVRIRRVDVINLNSQYKKPIIRKCPKCGIQLASFVKKCPNCNEKLI